MFNFENIKYYIYGFIIYLFVLTTITFLILFHVIDIKTIVESMRHCITTVSF